MNKPIFTQRADLRLAIVASYVDAPIKPEPPR